MVLENMKNLILAHTQSRGHLRMLNHLRPVPFHESFGGDHKKMTVGGFLDPGRPKFCDDYLKFIVIESIQSGHCPDKEGAGETEVKALNRVAFARVGMI